MADDLSQLMTRLQQLIPDLKGEFHTKFASDQVDHRRAIRHSLKTALAPNDNSIEDLSKLPRPTGWSVSISHCRSFGGWIGIPQPRRIGLDFENYSRINNGLVERICQKWELQRAPDPAFLWCAKEAYYKALGRDQPVTVSQIYIDDWATAPDGKHIFRGDGIPLGKGLILKADDLLVSICII